ncbi:SRPBCC family protein [Methylocystis sp. H62]|uniref:SRPBCC domain-containing protein n=1 Tax=Methylocystis sp. H62 TaxID=2785789 RepID=UPI0018C2E347|nr:SRPBCC domain-containing protein [Methylocystis sp. H62]MBG0792432.1 SRPBCC family protein [Methylocystis sp. H62]MBG0792918.1 SRPBCC family protein [Methylocystis sp. H62]
MLAASPVHHGTVVVEQAINVPVGRAYAAFADAKERTSWAAPTDRAVFNYEEADFRVGGRDVARCGAKDDPRFCVESRYLNIVPERCVVTVETINEDAKPLAVNITTTEFVPDGHATKVKVTAQVISFVGDDMIKNTEAGHAGSLANMARYLEQAQRDDEDVRAR